MTECIRLDLHDESGIAQLTLNDPARRNALSAAMFDAMETALIRIQRSSARVVRARGEGGVFCAGFDLEAVMREPEMMARFIERLSRINRALRRLPQVVVAEVAGAAIAGGCAMLSACDFVIVAPDAKLGYPVHRIGVSPAVTIPTLRQAVGPGPARSLLMGGELIDGREAKRLGLASHLAASAASLAREADELCANLAAKPPDALRITKAWLNEIDGSLLDEPFDAAVRASAALAGGEEAVGMLSAHWRRAKS